MIENKESVPFNPEKWEIWEDMCWCFEIVDADSEDDMKEIQNKVIENKKIVDRLKEKITELSKYEDKLAQECFGSIEHQGIVEVLSTLQAMLKSTKNVDLKGDKK